MMMTDSPFSYIIIKILVPSLIAYLYAMWVFRFDRLKRLRRRFGCFDSSSSSSFDVSSDSSTREALSKMTVDEAFAIHNDLVYLEFPRVFSTATMFALFKASNLPLPLPFFFFSWFSLSLTLCASSRADLFSCLR